MANQEAVKELVRDAYTQAIQSGSGCCTPAGTQTVTEGMKGKLVKLAGYSDDELRKLPEDSVQNAFGCGNPLAFAGVQPGQVVVDIGSGAGIDCLIAAEKVGPAGRVIGVDMTPAMIERARNNAARAGASNVEFRLGDAEKMPVENASADWIISNCVINLAPDKDAVFREVFRVLKPGGRVSISDVVLGTSLPKAIRESAEALVGCLAGAIDERTYLAKMQQAGLVDIEVAERLVYDRSQLLGLASDGCGCGSSTMARLESHVESIEGGVWSAKIYARKPLN